MGNRTKEDELYREMCRVVGKVVLEMRDLGQEPKHIVIAGVLRTALANKRIQRSELEKQAKAMGGEIVKVDKAPFRAAVQPLFDDFKKDPKQAALLEKFDNAAQ